MPSSQADTLKALIVGVSLSTLPLGRGLPEGSMRTGWITTCPADTKQPCSIGSVFCFNEHRRLHLYNCQRALSTKGCSLAGVVFCRRWRSSGLPETSPRNATRTAILPAVTPALSLPPSAYDIQHFFLIDMSCLAILVDSGGTLMFDGKSGSCSIKLLCFRL